MKWISIHDSLPEDAESVLISCPEGIHKAEFNQKGKRGRTEKNAFGPPYYGQDMSDEFREVSHWMVLPKAPPDEKKYPLLKEGYDALECPACNAMCYPDAKRSNGSIVYSRHSCKPSEGMHAIVRSFEIDEGGDIRE